MRLTNDTYLILISSAKSGKTERYYRDKDGWLKVSMRGRKFRMTAEQVLNHVLPAVAGVNPRAIIKVEHHEQLPDWVEAAVALPPATGPEPQEATAPGSAAGG